MNEERWLIDREIITTNTAKAADVYALGVSAIELVWIKRWRDW